MASTAVPLSIGVVHGAPRGAASETPRFRRPFGLGVLFGSAVGMCMVAVALYGTDASGSVSTSKFAPGFAAPLGHNGQKAAVRSSTPGTSNFGKHAAERAPKAKPGAVQLEVTPEVIQVGATMVGGIGAGIGVLMFTEGQVKRGEERGVKLSEDYTARLSSGMDDAEVSSVKDLGGLVASMDAALKAAGDDEVDDVEAKKEPEKKPMELEKKPEAAEPKPEAAKEAEDGGW